MTTSQASPRGGRQDTSRRSPCLVVFAAPLLAVAIGAAPAAAASDSDLESLQRELAGFVAASGTPGAAVALVDARGLVSTVGLGRADLESGRPVDGDTLFRVGSVTKSFLGLALMRLAEKGRLSPASRVRDLAPEITVENAWESSTPLRLEHLVEHTAGFDEMRFNEIFAQHGRENGPLGELLAVNPRSRIARWRPGTRFSYSQPGYTVAAYLLEKVSGMPYEQLLEEEVFGPLDIRSATFRLTPAARARLATGYEDEARQPYRPLLHRPAAGLMISARDLARLVAMLAGRGEIDGQPYLSPESIGRIERCGTLPFGAPAVSYGIANWGDVSQPVPTRGHGGWMPGYRSRFRYSPDRRFGYLVLVNDSGGSPAFKQMSEALLAHLLGGERPPAPPVVPVPPEDLAPLPGTTGWPTPRSSSNASGPTCTQASPSSSTTGGCCWTGRTGRRSRWLRWVAGASACRARVTAASSSCTPRTDGARSPSGASTTRRPAPRGLPPTGGRSSSPCSR